MALTLFGKCSLWPARPQVGRAPELGAGTGGARAADGARGTGASRDGGVRRLGRWVRSLAPLPLFPLPAGPMGVCAPGQFWDGRL